MRQTIQRFLLLLFHLLQQIVDLLLSSCLDRYHLRLCIIIHGQYIVLDCLFGVYWGAFLLLSDAWSEISMVLRSEAVIDFLDKTAL